MSNDCATFQHLAKSRLAEAELLLDNGLPSGAYYLAGYVIECALKAIIAKDFRANEIPDLKYVRDIYTHDLSALLRLAELEEQLDAKKVADPELYQSWTTVKTWSESARHKVWTQAEASAILAGVGGDKGLLGWRSEE